MSTVTITGGSVRIEDGVKRGEYEPPRKVAVELRFDVAEGADADDAIGVVSALAQKRVTKLLAASGAVTQDAAPVQTPAAPARTPKPAAAKETPEPAGKPAGKPKPVQSKASVADVVEEPEGSAFDAGEEEEEPTGDITDKDLEAKCEVLVPKLGSPVPIRQLVKKFVASGRLREIPQEKRAEFLRELKTLG